MISWKGRALLVNMRTLFIIVLIVVGLPACVGKAGDTKDSDSSSKPGTVKNGLEQAEETQEAQEAQPSCSPTPYVSRFATEEEPVISGKCGKDAVWTYNTASKLLQITGTGIVDQIIKKSKEYVSEYGVEQEYSVKKSGLKKELRHWMLAHCFRMLSRQMKRRRFGLLYQIR